MNTNKTAVWTVSSYVRSTHSEDGAVLLDIKKGVCYSLNVAAARVWMTIETSQTGINFAGILDAVETHFDVPSQELEADITECLGKLERMGLVHCDGRAALSKLSKE